MEASVLLRPTRPVSCQAFACPSASRRSRRENSRIEIEQSELVVCKIWRTLSCISRTTVSSAVPQGTSYSQIDLRIAKQNPRSVASRSTLLACLSLLIAGAANAAGHEEPSNALSIPTWMIHISSVIEWTAAMLLMWQYARVTGNEKWKGMTWGMMPLFAGALTACTYHFFYNSKDLEFLVTIQASLTWIGNATLWAAAYRIYKDTGDSSPVSRQGNATGDE